MQFYINFAFCKMQYYGRLNMVLKTEYLSGFLVFYTNKLLIVYLYPSL
jgi:hypothetical protein